MDEELEALIDRAGRDKVFAAALANGWEPGMSPPKWVWRALAHQVMEPALEPKSTLPETKETA